MSENPKRICRFCGGEMPTVDMHAPGIWRSEKDCELELLRSRLDTAEKAARHYADQSAEYAKRAVAAESRLNSIRQKCEAETRGRVETDFETGRADFAEAILEMLVETPKPFEAVLSCSVEGCGNAMRVTSDKPFKLDEGPWKCPRHDPPYPRVVERPARECGATFPPGQFAVQQCDLPTGHAGEHAKTKAGV